MARKMTRKLYCTGMDDPDNYVITQCRESYIQVGLDNQLSVTDHLSEKPPILEDMSHI